MSDPEVTRPERSRTDVPAQAGQPAAEAPGPWSDYLAAARQLDVVRRTATTSAEEQTTSLVAARSELAAVRARLAPQRARLVGDLGVPEGALTPTPADRDAAAAAMTGGPAAVLTALQQARITADIADAVMLGPGGPSALRPWVRNLLVYGPFAGAVLIAQIALFLIAPSGSLSTPALVCGLSLPVLAFGLGWVTIGFVYGEGGAKVDRTPLVGVLACLAPVLLTCMGLGLTRLL